MNEAEVPRTVGFSNSADGSGRSGSSTTPLCDDLASPTIPVTAQTLEFDSEAELESDDSPSREDLLVQNRELLTCLAELERSLSECQGNFQSYLEQFRYQEELLAQRDRDINNASEQVAQAKRDLKDAKRQVHRQEVLVETFKSQLEGSQERVAQMERECSLAQTRFADQAQQLLQAEALCRDLKSRLHRQQRYTLQFKSALERCLDVNVSSQSFDLPDLPVEPVESLDDYFPRSRPVKPWSSLLEEAESEGLESRDAADAFAPASLGSGTPNGMASGMASGTLSSTASGSLTGNLGNSLRVSPHPVNLDPSQSILAPDFLTRLPEVGEVGADLEASDLAALDLDDLDRELFEDASFEALKQQALQQASQRQSSQMPASQMPASQLPAPSPSDYPADKPLSVSSLPLPEPIETPNTTDIVFDPNLAQALELSLKRETEALMTPGDDLEAALLTSHQTSPSALAQDSAEQAAAEQLAAEQLAAEALAAELQARGITAVPTEALEPSPASSPASSPAPNSELSPALAVGLNLESEQDPWAFAQENSPATEAASPSVPGIPWVKPPQPKWVVAAAGANSAAPSPVASADTDPNQDSQNTPLSADPDAEAEAEETEGLDLTPNWPSPVVHPLRPSHKHIKTLAAIDLPTFPKP